MSFIKSFGAFCIGLVVSLLLYNYSEAPVFPCVSVYITALCFNDGKYLGVRRFFSLINCLLGIYFYSANAILSIIHFPQYSNAWGIIFDFITAFAFLSAGFVLIPNLKTDR